MDCGIQEIGWSFDYLETRGMHLVPDKTGVVLTNGRL